jgi:hypothetical protein
MESLSRERQQDAEHEALRKSAELLSGEMLAALKHGNLEADALFAPQVRDWRRQGASKRHQSVGEVVRDTLSTKKEFNALVNVVIRLAYTSDANLPEVARTLLDGIACDFGDHNATGETDV